MKMNVESMHGKVKYFIWRKEIKVVRAGIPLKGSKMIADEWRSYSSYLFGTYKTSRVFTQNHRYMYSISYMLTYVFVYLISLLCMNVYLFLFRKYVLKIINVLQGRQSPSV